MLLALPGLWRLYGIGVRPLARSIAHDAAVYLVDRAGYLVPFSPPILARDIQRITRGTLKALAQAPSRAGRR